MVMSEVNEQQNLKNHRSNKCFSSNKFHRNTGTVLQVSEYKSKGIKWSFIN